MQCPGNRSPLAEARRRGADAAERYPILRYTYRLQDRSGAAPAVDTCMAESDEDAAEIGRIWLLTQVELRAVTVSLNDRDIAHFERRETH